MEQVIIKQQFRQLVRHFGIDSVPHPLHDPLARTVRLLDQYYLFPVSRTAGVGCSRGRGGGVMSFVLD